MPTRWPPTSGSACRCARADPPTPDLLRSAHPEAPKIGHRTWVERNKSRGVARAGPVGGWWVGGWMGLDAQVGLVASVMSATVAPRAARAASASTVMPTPWAPAPRETRRPVTDLSETTGQGVLDPNGVIVPRS